MKKILKRSLGSLLVVFLIASLGATACSDDPEPVGNDDQDNQNQDPKEDDEPLSCEMTSWECEEFVDGPQLTERRHGHETIILDDGRALLLGGSSREEDSHASSRTNTWEVVNTDSEEVEDSGERPVFRQDFAAVKLDNGSVMTMGGHFNQQPLVSIDHFDPESHEWTHEELPDMDRSASHARVLDDGRIAVADVGSSDVYGQIFDPSALEWSDLVEADLPRSDVDQLSLQIHDDKQVVFTAAYVAEETQGVEFYNGAIFSFDLATGDVEELVHLEFEEPNVHGSSTLLGESEKSLLQFRAADLEGEEHPTQGFVFDPSTGDLSEEFQREPTPGNIHTVLPGDEVVYEDGQLLQLYHVPTQTWRTFTSLPDNIYYSSMEILPDCRLFLSGERTLGAPNDELRRVDTGFCTPVEEDDEEDNGQEEEDN